MQSPMKEAQPSPLGTPITSTLRLYVYGSCESDQFYHPGGENESKRPICLTDIEEFKQETEDDEEEESQVRLISNPLFHKVGKCIRSIACGGLHSIVLTTDGSVFTFGCNDEGALGRQGPEKLPLEVQLDEVVDLIAAGDNHSLFGNSVSGALYFTGNYKYMRGQKMVEPIRKPFKFHVGTIEARVKNMPIEKLVCGANHSCVLVGGRIFCRGEPEAFTVGRRVNQRHKTQNSLTFDGVGLLNVQDLWCGGYHSIAKCKKGANFSYFVWGLNSHGQLGTNSFIPSMYPVELVKLRGKDIVEVAAGTNFTIFLTSEGQMLGCGVHEYGQLGLGKDYVYIDSEAEQEQQIGKTMLEQMSLKDPGSPKILPAQVVTSTMAHESKKENNQSEKNKSEVNVQHKPDQPNHQQPKNTNRTTQLPLLKFPQVPPSVSQRFNANNSYIKTIKSIPFQDRVTRIAAGSQFAFAWNNKQLYSWGFGMNYVLLNGEEEDEYSPYRVRPKIINQQSIYELKAGGQHVLYTSFESNSRVQPRMSEHFREISLSSKQKLSRRRK